MASNTRREAVGMAEKIDAQPWTDREQAIYEIGHREGEGCREHDWQFALSEYCDLPDDINPANPVQVAEYIDRLQQSAFAQGWAAAMAHQVAIADSLRRPQP